MNIRYTAPIYTQDITTYLYRWTSNLQKDCSMSCTASWLNTAEVFLQKIYVIAACYAIYILGLQP